MKPQDFTDFFAFENYATFDRVRKLRWNNNAVLQALLYYKTVHGKKITYEKLITGITGLEREHIVAALYGALTAADAHMTLPIFGRIFKPEYMVEYIETVINGMREYMPDPEIEDAGADLDPDWPDTQAEVKKNKAADKATGGTGSGLQKASLISRWTKSKKRAIAE